MDEVLFGYTQLSDKDMVGEDAVIDYIILLYFNLAALEIKIVLMGEFRDDHHNIYNITYWSTCL